MVVIVATLAGLVQSDAVSLYNAQLKQMVTSSTLKWTTLKKEAMENYVTGVDSPQGKFGLNNLNFF